MPLITPIAEADARDRAENAFARIKEILEVEEVPEVFRYMGHVPAFVHDFFMNFRKHVLSDGKLSQQTKLLIAIAVAGQEGSQAWLRFLKPFANSHGIPEQQILDVLAVGATNAMYNVLFKFRDISGSDVFAGMAIGLRAHTFQNTSLDESTVEIINLALSDINSCKPCTSAHVAKARQLQVSDDAIYEAIQCAATMICGTQFLRSVGADR